MRQTILSIIFIAAVVGAGFFLYRFFTGAPQTEVFDSDALPQERLADYRKIKTLEPDLSIFADPFFKALFSPAQTFGVGAAPQPPSPGRANPFASF